MSPSVATDTHCPYCSLQCGMSVVAGDRPATLTPQEDFPTNRGGLCSKGWTAAELLDHPHRLLTPLVREVPGDRSSALRPASWDEALGRVAAAIIGAQERYGNDGVGCFGGGGLTNEKAYAFGKFARVALRSALPTAWSVLKALPAKHTIKEPAYKDMVVLYRRVVPDEQVGRGGGGVAAAATAAGTRKEHGLGRLTPPTVHAPRCARPKRSPSGTTTRRPRGATSTSSASSTFRRRTSKWSSPTKRSGSNHSS